MKKSSLKSLTFVLALSMATILLALRRNVLARKKSAPRLLLTAIPPLKGETGFVFIFNDHIFVVLINAVCCILMGKNKNGFFDLYIFL